MTEELEVETEELTFKDWEALMVDNRAANNYGRRKRSHNLDKMWCESASLETDHRAGDLERNTYMMVETTHPRYYGMTGGRRDLTEAEFEFVDWDLVRQMVAAELGFPWDEIAALYVARPGGRPSAEFNARRASLDEAVLRVVESGGNVGLLARVFGWPVRKSGVGGCATMKRTVQRARQRRAAAREETAMSYHVNLNLDPATTEDEARAAFEAVTAALDSIGQRADGHLRFLGGIGEDRELSAVGNTVPLNS